MRRPPPLSAHVHLASLILCLSHGVLSAALDNSTGLQSVLNESEGWWQARPRGRRAISEGDMHLILDLHNKLRGQVHPPASNMEYMVSARLLLHELRWLLLSLLRVWARKVTRWFMYYCLKRNWNLLHQYLLLATQSELVSGQKWLKFSRNYLFWTPDTGFVIMKCPILILCSSVHFFPSIIISWLNVVLRLLSIHWCVKLFPPPFDHYRYSLKSLFQANWR